MSIIIEPSRVIFPKGITPMHWGPIQLSTLDLLDILIQ